MNDLRDDLRQDFKDEEYAHTYVDDFLNAEIATQIKVLREQRELTQQQLAELAGMAQPRLSLLEDVNYGSWSIKTLKKLARAFDVTLKVSFETFSSRMGDIASFNRRALQREKRSDEMARNGERETSASIVDLLRWQKDRNRPTTQDIFSSENGQKMPPLGAPRIEDPALLAAQRTR